MKTEMKNEIKKMVDAFIEKQIKSYEKTNNYDRCYHRIQGYVACLRDMGIIADNELFDVLNYMTDKFDDMTLNLQIK